MTNKVVVTNKDALNGKRKSEHERYQFTKYEVTPREDFEQVYVSFYELPPEKENYPYHYHEVNTEVFYIIEGEGILRTEEGEREVKKGDVIVCPPRQKGAHKLRNTSKEKNLVYLDVDTTNSPDLIHYPDSKKIGVVVHNCSSNFYEEEKTVDYYKGE